MNFIMGENLKHTQHRLKYQQVWKSFEESITGYSTPKRKISKFLKFIFENIEKNLTEHLMSKKTLMLKKLYPFPNKKKN